MTDRRMPLEMTDEQAEAYALALDAEANRALGFAACPGDHSQPTCTTCRAAV